MLRLPVLHRLLGAVLALVAVLAVLATALLGRSSAAGPTHVPAPTRSSAAQPPKTVSPPSPLTPSEYAFAVAQETVDAVVARIMAVVEDRPGSGYVGLRVDIEKLGVQVWWRGEPPAEVRAIAADPSDRVDVEIRAGTYTSAELSAAVHRLLQDALSKHSVLRRLGIVIQGGERPSTAAGWTCGSRPRRCRPAVGSRC